MNSLINYSNFKVPLSLTRTQYPFPILSVSAIWYPLLNPKNSDAMMLGGELVMLLTGTSKSNGPIIFQSLFTITSGGSTKFPYI